MQHQNLIVTWKDSINLFAWKECKVLLLASLNNFRRALKLTITYFWWLWALWIALLILPIALHVVITPHYLFDSVVLEKIPTSIPPFRLFNLPWVFTVFSALTIAFSVIDAFIHFTYFLSTRASIEAKNFSYYWHHFPKIILFGVTQLIISFCVTPLALLPTFFTLNPSILGISTTIITAIFAALPAFVGFAFFDHEKNTVAIALKKGLLLFIYFFPIAITVSLLYLVLLLLIYSITILTLLCTTLPWLVMGIVFSVFFVQSCIISLLFLSCFATLYLKIKHTHPNIFFIK